MGGHGKSGLIGSISTHFFDYNNREIEHDSISGCAALKATNFRIRLLTSILSLAAFIILATIPRISKKSLSLNSLLTVSIPS